MASRRRQGQELRARQRWQGEDEGWAGAHVSATWLRPAPLLHPSAAVPQLTSIDLFISSSRASASSSWPASLVARASRAGTSSAAWASSRSVSPICGDKKGHADRGGSVKGWNGGQWPSGQGDEGAGAGLHALVGGTGEHPPS